MTKRVSSPSGVASMRATARRSRLQGHGLVARFGVAAHDGLVRQSALGVVDMDRQEATLVVMGVEERELLMPVNDAGVIDIEYTDAGSRS